MFSQQIRRRLFVSFPILLLSFALTGNFAWADSNTAKRATPVPDGERAAITLNVPLDAIVFIDGQRTYNTGLTRRFVTPPLAPGKTYCYDVKVAWLEGSRPESTERHLSFKAGERMAVNLAQPNWTEYQQDLYMDPAAPAPWRLDYYNDVRNFPNIPNSPYIFPGTRPYPAPW